MNGAGGTSWLELAAEGAVEHGLEKGVQALPATDFGGGIKQGLDLASKLRVAGNH